MQIHFHVGDIFSVAAEGFISTGNVQLNMTGGINGALMSKFGHPLQVELHDFLKFENVKQVAPGFVYKFKIPIPPYKTVLYSVGVDVWYNSSIELVLATLRKSLNVLIEDGCKSAVTAAIGTGYGKLKKFDFGKAIQILKSEYSEFPILYVVERNQAKMDEIISGFEST